MTESVHRKVIQFLKGRKKPISIPQIAEATGCPTKQVREVIRIERKVSGSKVFRIGGYAVGGARKAIGYLLGPGEDEPVVKYGHKRRPWSRYEESQLRRYVGSMPLAKVSELLNRDQRLVREKLRAMGLEKGYSENVVPRGLEHLGSLPPDAVQKQWEGGHIFKLKGDKPGILGVTIHNTARRGEDRELRPVIK